MSLYYICQDNLEEAQKYYDHIDQTEENKVSITYLDSLICYKQGDITSATEKMREVYQKLNYPVLKRIANEWFYKEEQARKDAIVRYENKLNAALSRRYEPDEQAKFLVYFDVDYNGQNIDTLCIVATVNGLDLVNVVTSDGGKTLDIIVLDSHIDISKPHLIKSVVSNYYIGYRIYTTPINKDDFYNVIEFTYDNQKYLLGIDYVDITPKD